MKIKLARALMAASIAGFVAIAVAQTKSGSTGAFRHLEVPGIENFFALSERVYSGSSPTGDAAFAELARLGVKTIISVDGAKPEVEAAARHGIRYVHIPVGYNGISATNALQLVKAVETLPGPVFVHCHHGIHRGPTAAAVICEGTAGWSPEVAEQWLRTVGTATNYPGLYETVRAFRAPSAETLRLVPANFPARAGSADLVDAMVQIDGHMDALKASGKAGFRPPPDHPDLSPVNESLMLWELFREAHRTRLGGQRGEKFLADLAGAESATADLHTRLQELDAARTDAQRIAAAAALEAVTKSCTACHRAHRDRVPTGH